MQFVAGGLGVSKQALQWAKDLESSRGVWMPRSHWRVLRVVAQFYHEALGCAFATVQRLAEEAGISGRHLRRIVAELDEMGIVKRNAAQRCRDKSDASNEYELPAYRLVTTDAVVRRRIFSIARAHCGAGAAGHSRCGPGEALTVDAVLSVHASDKSQAV
jgi:DNA-binding Lrp family transcriptional regulator